MTPAPSSDAPEMPSSQEDEHDIISKVDIGLPSPSTPAKRDVKQGVHGHGIQLSSPSRKASSSFQNQREVLIDFCRPRKSSVM